MDHIIGDGGVLNILCKYVVRSELFGARLSRVTGQLHLDGRHIVPECDITRSGTAC